MGIAHTPNGAHKYCTQCGSPTEKYMTIDELAHLTSMSVEFWRARIKARDIDHVKIGRSVRIAQSSLTSVIKLVPAINTNNITNMEIE